MNENLHRHNCLLLQANQNMFLEIIPLSISAPCRLAFVLSNTPWKFKDSLSFLVLPWGTTLKCQPDLNWF